MCKDDCHKYEKKSIYNRSCKHFTGDDEQILQKTCCKRYCDIYKKGGSL